MMKGSIWKGHFCISFFQIQAFYLEASLAESVVDAHLCTYTPLHLRPKKLKMTFAPACSDIAAGNNKFEHYR